MTRTGAGNRTAAFLATVHPDVSAIDHVVLSHPHQDHVELLADIIRGHTIGDVWDSGAPSDICGYRAFLRAVADTGVRYHTAKADEPEMLKMVRHLLATGADSRLINRDRYTAQMYSAERGLDHLTALLSEAELERSLDATPSQPAKRMRL
jgi:ribonuclease BN (tRNA processing enzyme)